MTISPQTLITLLAPVFPRLSQALTVQWSDGHAIEPWQAQLLRFIAVSNWDAQNLPAADLFRISFPEAMSDTGLQPDAPLVFADPVHFRAERDSATLIPAEMLHLNDRESDALLESINDFLQPDRLHVSRTASGQWLMSGKDGSRLASYPPSFLAHRNASAYLSDDDSSGSWRRLMTELQMLLHAHPVNSEREKQGHLPVNSVWFWGGASLVSDKMASAITPQRVRLFADDSFTVAIARHLDLVCEPLAAFDPTSGDLHSLLIDTRITQAMFADDETGMEKAEHHIVNQWIAPIQARIEAGEDINLDIFNEDGMQGKLNVSVIRAVTDAARAVRISEMSLTERLSDRLAGGAGNLWKGLREKMSGGA